MATVNEPLRCEITSGYRNDRIHWHLQEPDSGGVLTYSELYRDVEYWENGLDLKVIHRDLTFFLRGAYGTFGRGTVYQRYANLAGQPHFRFDTDGWTADAVGYFGYAVNLTADRIYKVIITPLIGYSAYWEQLKRTKGRATSGILEGFQSQLPGDFRLLWNGVLLGGAFLIEPANKLIFNVGYTYHFIHNRVHTHVENSFTSESIKTSSGGNKGHTGWAQLDYTLNCLWRVGLGAQMHYFFTRVVDAAIHQPSGNFSENFKLRWTSVSGWLQFSREF